ncbi:hypothetical protein ACFQAV_08190 [Companilactobacillus huachuanensis]|uniref:Uncharacterized protein n=1 Tax=Companilactobacillus huachuanensis TaxID=2559914 RepID=A0ABW1RL53_9LACO|nr:hypothetical protein [Companilactobacillus huachuanensis]
MLKFGKKINYRPLLISLLIAALPAVAAGDSFKSFFLGLLIGLPFFLYVFFAYYFPNIPTLFVYWTSDTDEIKYCDIQTWKYRLLGMVDPFAAKMVTIKKSDIKLATVIGDLSTNYEMPMAIPFGAGPAVLSPVLSMIHHPDSVVLTLKDNSTIELSVARDYAYSRDDTLDKLDAFFKSLGTIPVKAKIPEDRKHLSTPTV